MRRPSELSALARLIPRWTPAVSAVEIDHESQQVKMQRPEDQFEHLAGLRLAWAALAGSDSDVADTCSDRSWRWEFRARDARKCDLGVR